MSSDPKNYFGFTFEEFTELMYAKKIAQLLLTQPFVRLPVTSPNRLTGRQSEIFTEFRVKSSIKPVESIGVSFEMSSDPKNYFGLHSMNSVNISVNISI